MYLYNERELNKAIKAITTQPVEIYFGSDTLIFTTTPSLRITKPFRIIPIISHKATFLIHIALDQEDQIQIDFLKGLITHFLDLNFSSDPSQQLQLSDNLRLINILSGSEKATDNDIKSLSSQLNYHHDLPRYAIIFNIKFNWNIEKAERVNFQAFFLDTIQAELMLDTEDIYSFMDFEKFILFKHVQSKQPEKMLDWVDSSLERINSVVTSKYEVKIEIGVGSVYSSLAQLDHSFRQALFLISYYSQLSNRPNAVLHINDFLFEYLSSCLPQSYIDRKYEQYSALSEKNPALYDTFGALSRNSHVLVDAARELGIHRNTLSQHMNKFTQQLSVDPLYLDEDRFKVKQFYIISQKKTLLSAGIVIQDDSTLHLGLDKFAKLLYKNSDGRILLNIHNISLSGDNENLIKILQNGTIDFAVAAISALEPYTNSRMSTLELPFLFDSPTQAHQILDGAIGCSLMNLLTPAEIVGLSFWSMGWRHITSNTPIRIPDDLNGLKIRIMHNNIMQKFYTLCGATPVKIKYGHVLLSLMQNLIDGQDNPYTNVKSMEFYLYQNYISEINCCYDLVALLMSRQSWNKLDDSQRNIIQRSVAEATKWQREESQRSNYIDKQWLINNNLLQCIIPTDKERLAWLEAIKPIYENHPFQEDLRRLTLEKSMLAAKGIYYDKHRIL